jgi:hypothetical protein
MRTERWVKFIKDERAGVALEFVALLQAFLFLFFFVLEIAIAMFWVGTAEKAVQIGARLAIVTNPVAAGVPAINAKRSSGVFGVSCNDASDPCTGFDPVSCSGAACVAGDFDFIVDRMSSVFALLDNLPNPGRDYVTVTYSYVGLGHAGGPAVPGVTVTLSGVPYDAVMTNILAGFMRLVTGDPEAASPMTQLPTVAVTFTGEDLTTAGAS